MARNTNGTGFSLKDELFNRQKVRWLANQFAAADNSFDAKAFERQVMKDMLKRELKARITHIAVVLEDFLDEDFAVAAKQIAAALPPELDPQKTDDDFGDFILTPLGEYVVQHGCTKKHLARSLSLLKQLTKRFSMEFYIRPFIDAFPSETMKKLEEWATDDNYHVRRLVSEGTRSLLPWVGRLRAITFDAPVPLLTTLHTDSTRYVTRSVANHVNDISKRDPALALRVLKHWYKLAQQDAVELAWITRHALRTLIKQGDTGALHLLGYHACPAVTVSKVSRTPATLALGEGFTFSFVLTAKKDESLLIDYIIDFVKKNGTTAPKVFKLKEVQIRKGESVTIEKRHLLKANSTTFTYYPGEHTVTLQINGSPYNSFTFTLRD